MDIPTLKWKLFIIILHPQSDFNTFILYTLKSLTENFECVIEWFDFLLKMTTKPEETSFHDFNYVLQKNIYYNLS